jgi:methionyl-tRNA formyltransferase
MKIGFFSGGHWGRIAIEMISAKPEFEISFIVPRMGADDHQLIDVANEFNIPVLYCDDVNSEDSISHIKSYNADLFVSLSYNQIIKQNLLNLAPKGFINCHAGALPYYRGCNPLNWVLINGEKEFGITVHYIDEGIDTGDIIVQQIYPISHDDDYASLLGLATKECAIQLYRAIVKISASIVEKIKQDDIHPVGTYFGRRIQGDELVDFSWSSQRIYNFVRAINHPAPLARFFIGEQEYGISSCELIPDAPDYISTIGEIVGRSESGNIIKTGDSTLKLTGVCEISDGERSETFVPKFRIGTRVSL